MVHRSESIPGSFATAWTLAGAVLNHPLAPLGDCESSSDGGSWSVLMPMFHTLACVDRIVSVPYASVAVGAWRVSTQTASGSVASSFPLTQAGIGFPSRN